MRGWSRCSSSSGTRTGLRSEHRVSGCGDDRGARDRSAHRRCIHLCGDDPHGQEDIASLLAMNAGRHLYVLRAENLPAGAAEIDQLVALWAREAQLLPAILLVQCGAAVPSPAVRQVLERLPRLILASREPLRLERPLLRYDVDKPEPVEQKFLWQHALGAAADDLNEMIDDLAEQFRLSAETISVDWASQWLRATAGRSGTSVERVPLAGASASGRPGAAHRSDAPRGRI